MFSFQFIIKQMYWQTAQRKILLDKTLVMAILNVTPDSFSDGGKYIAVDDALRQAEKLISEGANILDIGGESTRPNSDKVSAEDETRRVVPIIEAIAKRFDTLLSIDTTKAEVAENAMTAGAEIINDISGLRFDERLAEVAARTSAGLILMHSRGVFETMHKQKPVASILSEVAAGWRSSIEKAESYAVEKGNIVLDVGIGFGKTLEQNLELLAKLKSLADEFTDFPLLVGTSRKTFIGRILDDAPTDQRLSGSLASVTIAVWNGAHIVRVHDVRATVETLKVVDRIKGEL